MEGDLKYYNIVIPIVLYVPQFRDNAITKSFHRFLKTGKIKIKIEGP